MSAAATHWRQQTLAQRALDAQKSWEWWRRLGAITGAGERMAGHPIPPQCRWGFAFDPGASREERHQQREDLRRIAFSEGRREGWLDQAVREAVEHGDLDQQLATLTDPGEHAG